MFFKNSPLRRVKGSRVKNRVYFVIACIYSIERIFLKIVRNVAVKFQNGTSYSFIFLYILCKKKPLRKRQNEEVLKTSSLIFPFILNFEYGQEVAPWLLLSRTVAKVSSGLFPQPF
jgi:hypothetical protein